MTQELSGLFDGLVELGGPDMADRLEQAPAKRGVLALLGQDGQPILLLTAADLRARLKGRLRQAGDDQPRTKMPDLKAVTARVGWKLAFSHFQADLHFLQLARRLWGDSYADLLAWKPPRFVHCDARQEFPRLARVEEFSQPGVYLGPFQSAAATDRFIEVLVDAFDLCRDPRILVRAPRGEPCVYGELGRCLRVCDGKAPLDQYRQAVRRAVDYAAGRREEYRHELAERMRQAAAKLDFEQAAAMKSRLERLGELDSAALRHVGTLERFRYILIQPGPKRSCALSFLATPHDCQAGPELDYPPAQRQLQDLLERMDRLGREAPGRACDPWLMGLVSHYLFSSPQRAGLIVRREPGLGSSELSELIEQSADRLRLKAPRRAS